MKFFFAGIEYEYEVSYENGIFVIIAQNPQNQTQAQITHLNFIVNFLEVDNQEAVFKLSAWHLPLKQADKLIHKAMRLVYSPDLVAVLEQELATQESGLAWQTF
jgi:hypothetical protein